MYGPLGERARALYRPPICSPCINVHENKVSSCIWGFPQCLVSLSVDESSTERRVASSSARTWRPTRWSP
jgi:hypothetical protein